MRVLIAMLSVGFAGTERHALELANALSRRCEVAVLLRARPREPHRQAHYDALRRTLAPHIPVFVTSRALPALGLWRALLRFRPDLIHAHHERSARIASRFARGVPVIATVHMHYRARDFARCHGLILLTQAEADATPASYRGQRFIIGNWVLEEPRPSPSRLAALRDELGLRPDDFVIGSVARLEPVKGLAGLINAFHAAQLPAGRLLLVGEGSLRAELQALCARLGLGDRVVFAGFRHDVRQLYFLFDAFALNSLDDPYPLAILEAAASGLPVIASATIGATAIAALAPVRLVPIGDDAALAAALRAVRQHPGGGTAAAPAGLTIDHRVAQILDAYRHTLAAVRPGRSAATLPAGES